VSHLFIFRLYLVTDASESLTVRSCCRRRHVLAQTDHYHSSLTTTACFQSSLAHHQRTSVIRAFTFNRLDHCNWLSRGNYSLPAGSVCFYPGHDMPSRLISHLDSRISLRQLACRPLLLMMMMLLRPTHWPGLSCISASDRSTGYPLTGFHGPYRGPIVESPSIRNRRKWLV